jgi:hypothetical protein
MSGFDAQYGKGMSLVRSHYHDIYFPGSSGVIIQLPD